MQRFGQGQLGKVVANLAHELGQRPSDMLGIEGSHLERLLWDLAITTNIKIAVEPSGVVRGPQSVKDKIRERRRRLGITSYIS